VDNDNLNYNWIDCWYLDRIDDRSADLNYDIRRKINER